jgi:hypothetical protein
MGFSGKAAWTGSEKAITPTKHISMTNDFFMLAASSIGMRWCLPFAVSLTT